MTKDKIRFNKKSKCVSNFICSRFSLCSLYAEDGRYVKFSNKTGRSVILSGRLWKPSGLGIKITENSFVFQTIEQVNYLDGGKKLNFDSVGKICWTASVVIQNKDSFTWNFLGLFNFKS